MGYAIKTMGERGQVLQIDLDKLRASSKPEVVEAAKVIEDSLNHVPYMELTDGHGGYGLHVKQNANADFCIPFETALKAGHEEALGALHIQVKELEKKLTEKENRIGELWDEVLKLRRENQDLRVEGVRDREAREEMEEATTREMKARSELLNILNGLKAIINKLP